MKIVYHPSVQKDLNRIIRHYDTIDPKLSDQFWDEFVKVVNAVSKTPKRFHFENNGRRRANLIRFPYHVIFRGLPDRIKIIAVKHHRRNPMVGHDRF